MLSPMTLYTKLCYIDSLHTHTQCIFLHYGAFLLNRVVIFEQYQFYLYIGFHRLLLQDQ